MGVADGVGGWSEVKGGIQDLPDFQLMINLSFFNQEPIQHSIP